MSYKGQALPTQDPCGRYFTCKALPHVPTDSTKIIMALPSNHQTNMIKSESYCSKQRMANQTLNPLCGSPFPCTFFLPLKKLVNNSCVMAKNTRLTTTANMCSSYKEFCSLLFITQSLNDPNDFTRSLSFLLYIMIHEPAISYPSMKTPSAQDSIIIIFLFLYTNDFFLVLFQFYLFRTLGGS